MVLFCEKMCWTVHSKGAPKGSPTGAAATLGNKVYYFGGLPRENGQMEVHFFNTVSLSWKKLPPVTDERGECLELPSKRIFHTAVPIDDNVYVWGGIPYCNIIYAFNVTTHRWFVPNVSGTVPEARGGHSACVLGQIMYIYGGYVRFSGNTNDIYKLDTTTMVWSLIAARGTPAPASLGHSATIIGKKMFVFGGEREEDDNGDDYSNNISVFHLEANHWLSTPSAQLLPEGRKGHSAFAYNGELYIFGGFHQDISISDLWKFNPETFSWKKLEPKGKFPPQHSWMCCCVVGDRVILFDEDLYILDLDRCLGAVRTQIGTGNHDDKQSTESKNT